jgi:hypothetical protein
MRYVQITDESDAFVARVNLPNEKGLHRVAWDFRKAPLPGARFRPWAFPGKYKAIIIEWDGKESKKLSEAVTFVVEPLQTPTIPPVDRKDVEEFQKALMAQQSRLTSVSRKLTRAGKMLDEAKGIVTNSMAEPATYLAEISAMQVEISAFEKSLFGSPILNDRFIEQIPTPANRLSTIMFSAFGSTHGPTKTHREQFEIAKKELSESLPKLEQFLNDRVNAFKKKLEGLGIELTNEPN